jgi:hypothetical protein
MIISLPDVNIWIALAAEGHVHHVLARDWFTAQPDASVASCWITQMGLLRLLTNPKVMGRAPRTIVQAWETVAQLRADRRPVFATEPDSVESHGANSWHSLEWGRAPGRMPTWPLFPRRNSYSLVTLDTGFKRWPALKLTLLSSSQSLPGK